MAKKEPAKSRAAKTAASKPAKPAASKSAAQPNPARRRSAKIHPPLPGQRTLADFAMDKKGASGASASAILHVAEPARQELLAGEELTGDEKQQIDDYEKQQIENAATTTNKETSAEPDPKCDEELASMPRRCLQVTQSPLRPSLPKAATVAQPAQSKVVAQIVLPWPSNTPKKYDRHMANSTDASGKAGPDREEEFAATQVQPRQTENPDDGGAVDTGAPEMQGGDSLPETQEAMAVSMQIEEREAPVVDHTVKPAAEQPGMQGCGAEASEEQQEEDDEDDDEDWDLDCDDDEDEEGGAHGSNLPDEVETTAGAHRQGVAPRAVGEDDEDDEEDKDDEDKEEEDEEDEEDEEEEQHEDEEEEEEEEEEHEEEHDDVNEKAGAGKAEAQPPKRSSATQSSTAPASQPPAPASLSILLGQQFMMLPDRVIECSGEMVQLGRSVRTSFPLPRSSVH